MSEKTIIPIEAANQLTVDAIPGERVPLGSPGDYKPCVARLPDGTLLLVCFFGGGLEEGLAREEILLYRSTDDGQTWSRPRNLTLEQDVLGREPYLTVLRDGTLLITVHFLANDVRNPAGYTRSFVHRSDDEGATWTTTVAEPTGTAEMRGTCTTRTVLELHDGSLMLGVAGRGGQREVWRSSDGGRTWTEKFPSKIEELDPAYDGPFFGEGVWWQVQSGKIYLLNRMNPHYVGRFAESVPKDKYGRTDNVDRMILYETTDEGHTFQPSRPMGEHGEMYPALLRMADGRPLLTFTVRSLRDPVGVRCVVGNESEDDIQFDMVHDRFMIDTQTPKDIYSGGGFGRTVQTNDGTLLTSYSWLDASYATHVEVMRWKMVGG